MSGPGIGSLQIDNMLSIKEILNKHFNEASLPMSIRILSKLLNKYDLKIEISETPLDLFKIMSIKIEGDPNELTILDHIDHMSVDEIVNILEKNLSNNQKLKIYKLISHMNYEESTRTLTFFSNCKWYDRKDKLTRITKIN